MTGHLNTKSAQANWHDFIDLDTKFIFNGGSALALHFWQEKFRECAQENGVWDLIALPDGTIQSMTRALNAEGAVSVATVLGDLVEEVFSHVDPTRGHRSTVQGIIQDECDKVDQFFQQRIYDLEATTMPSNVRREEQKKLREEWAKTTFKIERTENSVTKDLAISIEAYNKAKIAWNDRCGKCLKLFNAHLGPGPKGHIRKELNNYQFRAAWLSLFQWYNLSICDGEHTTNMQQMLNNVTFEPHLMSPDEFVEKFQSLIELYRGQGHTVDDKTYKAYIINALKRAHVEAYKMDLYHAEAENKPLSWVMERISKNHAHENMRKYLKRTREDIKPARPSQEEAEFSGMVTTNNFNPGDYINAIANLVKQNASEGRVVTFAAPTKPSKIPRKSLSAMIVICSKCEKPGHEKKDCWSDKICPKCNKKGHIEAFCREDPSSSPSAQSYKLNTKFNTNENGKVHNK